MIDSVILDMELFIPSFKEMFHDFASAKIVKAGLDIPEDLRDVCTSYDMQSLQDWLHIYTQSSTDHTKLHSQFIIWLKSTLQRTPCPDEFSQITRVCKLNQIMVAVISHGTRTMVREMLERWHILSQVDYLLTDSDIGEMRHMLPRLAKDLTDDTNKCVGITNDYATLMVYKRSGVKTWFVNNSMCPVNDKFLENVADLVINSNQHLMSILEKEVC